MKYSTLLNISIGLLVLDIMIDPPNLIFHSKYLLFVIVFLIWFLKIIKTKTKIVVPKSLFFVLAFISLFMPFYALSVGIINSILNDTEIGTLAYFNSFFFFLLLLVIVNENIELTKFINYSSLMVVGITLGFYLILLLSPTFFTVIYHYFVIDKGVAVYALRNYGGVTLIMMFYKTSPILVFPLSYYLYRIFITPEKRRLIPDIIVLCLIIAALFISGTRANVVSLIAIVLFYFGFYIYKKSKEWFVLINIASLLLALFALPVFFDLLLNKHEASNMIKFGHFSSYLDHFENHKIMSIFGQGIGGSFYSSGINKLSNISELTYLELIRIWGFPITLLFLSALILPLINEIRSKNISHIFIAYITYLFIAGTNPLLLSSTGMIVLVYVFSFSYYKCYKTNSWT